MKTNKLHFILIGLCAVAILMLFPTRVSAWRPTPSPAPTSEPVNIGDVNFDSMIDAKDALLVLRQAARLETFSVLQFCAADYNGDSQISAEDALMILKRAAKLINTIPYNESAVTYKERKYELASLCEYLDILEDLDTYIPSAGVYAFSFCDTDADREPELILVSAKNVYQIKCEAGAAALTTYPGAVRGNIVYISDEKGEGCQGTALMHASEKLSASDMLRLYTKGDFLTYKDKYNIEYGNIRETYDLESKTLIISGTGEVRHHNIIPGHIMPPYIDWDREWAKDDVEHLVIKEGVTAIGYTAFSRHGIRSLQLPASVEEIKYWAFDGCYHLSEITLPKGFEIGLTGVFNDTELYRDRKNWDGDSFYLANYLVKYEGKKKNDIPIIREGTEVILPGAFAQDRDVLAIVFNNGLKEVRDSFSGVRDRLKAVFVPDSVEYIWKGFYQENVTIYCNEGSYAHKFALENHIKYNTDYDMTQMPDMDQVCRILGVERDQVCIETEPSEPPTPTPGPTEPDME